jgi:hypothetical protein
MQLRHLTFFCMCVIASAPLLFGIADHGHRQWHLRWQQAFFESWQQGVWLPSWIADLDHGLGAPVFSFYAPGSFALGALFQSVGFTSLTAYKLVLANGQILSLAAGHKVDTRFGAALMLLPVMFLSYFWQAPAALLGGACAVWSLKFANQESFYKAACWAVLCSAFHTISAFVLMIALFWQTVRAIFSVTV